MTDERFEMWRGGLAGFDDAVGFVVVCVAEGLETVAHLSNQGAGGEVVEHREGEYKSWDAEILRVDKDVEDGFRRRLAGLGEPVVLLSEEAGRVELGDGEPTAFAVADPFDGSWLFRRGVPDFWYSSLALYDAALRPICSAVGDAIHRVIAFADETGAYRVRADDEGLGGVTKLDAGFRRAMGRPDVSDPAKAGIESYAMKPTKFLLPLVDRYRPVIEAFRFFLPNGGPYGFVDVAEGKVDVYFAPRQPFVDIFSGIGIAEQAEAIVTDFDGRPVAPSDDPETLWDVVASTNQPLQDQVLELISRCQ
ncbi:MAG: hypothetical protein R6V58_16520 [Planctomycetota bacterium]